MRSDGREFGELVNAERLLEIADLTQRALEAAGAEELVLLNLEPLAELIELRFGELPAIDGEQLRIFPGRVRRVHAAEVTQVRDHAPSLRGGGGLPRLRLFDDRLGEPSPCGVLRAQHAGQLDERSRALELRKHELLFQLLVITLYEAVHDVRGRGHDDQRRVVIRGQAVGRFVVDEQDAAKNAVLSHEILRGRNVVPLALVLRTAHGGCEQPGGDARRPDQEPPASSIVVFHLGHTKSRSARESVIRGLRDRNTATIKHIPECAGNACSLLTRADGRTIVDSRHVIRDHRLLMAVTFILGSFPGCGANSGRSTGQGGAGGTSSSSGIDSGVGTGGQSGSGADASGNSKDAGDSHPGLGPFVAITAGDVHTCALLPDTTVRCWGFNQDGELGNGTSANSSTPVAVSNLTGVTAISASGPFTCALLGNGTVECWGSNGSGQLGVGIASDGSLTPVPVSNLAGVTSISTGATGINDGHSCALLSDETVQCWGYNVDGHLLHGEQYEFESFAPVAIPGLAGVKAISVGGDDMCALMADTTVQCWNENLRPALVANLSGVSSLAVGDSHCAVLLSGTVACWGDNNDGQLGNGLTGTGSVSPVAVLNVTTARAISAASFSTCALLQDATIACWGNNADGQFGGSGIALSHVPIPVVVPNANGIAAIAMGASHACVLFSQTGMVQCWGDNRFGQLGP